MIRKWQKYCKCETYKERFTSNPFNKHVAVCANCGRYPAEPVEESYDGLFEEVSTQESK